MRRGMMLLVWTLLAGCDDTIFENHSGGGAPVTGSGYTAVQTIFSNSCLSGCHEAAVATAGLDLETDPCSAVVGVTSSIYGAPLVSPGDSAGSVLWDKMAANGNYGGTMPPAGAVDADTLAIVTDWIDSGADCSGDTTSTNTFARVQSEVFDEHCVECHEPSYTPPNEVPLAKVPVLEAGESYDNIVNVASGWVDSGKTLIVPGDPEASFLVEKISGSPSHGKQMPRDKDALDAELVDLVYNWVLEGANP